MNTINDINVWIFTFCSLMTSPVILIGTIPLCHGGILSDDFTVPVVAFCSQFHV